MALSAGDMIGFHVQRIFCIIPVQLIFFYRGTMYNFSKEGLYFESNEDLLKGHEISISILKPPQKFTKKPHQYFDIKIMWCLEIKGSSYRLGYGAKLM